MKKLLLLCSAFFFLSLNYANAQGTEANYWETLAGTTTNCVNGEDIDFEIQIHWVEKNNGSIHVNAQGTGVGQDTGAKYVIRLSQKFSTGNSGNSETTVVSISFIAQGKVPNYQGKLVAHTTTNANGDVTVDFEMLRENCP